jgi:hypothetical protein
VATNEEAIHIRVTGKQLSAAVLALVTFVSSVVLTIVGNVPASRFDPFTGADGAELERRIAFLERDIKLCQRTVDKYH